jgi:hypothetical protein
MRASLLTSVLACTVLAVAAPAAASTPPTEPTTTTTTPESETTDESGPGSFAVQPSGPDGPGGRDYFVYTLKPGESFGDVVGISNLSDRTQTYVIYATDAFNTPNDAGFALLREDDTPTDVGTWIRLAADQYTLEPGERADIPFEISVPLDATPGDHAGAIVAQPVDLDPSDPAGGLGFDVRTRIGARIYTRVEGPITAALTIEDLQMSYDAPLNPFATAPAKVSYRVTNTGNIRISATALLDINGLFGAFEWSAPDRQLPELLPGSSLVVSETIHGVRPVGRLTAELLIESPNDGVRTGASVSQWAIPWLLVIAVVALIVVLIVLWVRRRRRRTEVAGSG